MVKDIIELAEYAIKGSSIKSQKKLKEFVNKFYKGGDDATITGEIAKGFKKLMER